MSSESDIAYSKFGHGPKNLVFIHGYCERKEMWNGFIPLLDDLNIDFTIYCIDLPGFGESPFDTNISNIHDVAEKVFEFSSSESINEAVWVGHSLGGYVLMSLQAAHPQLISGLCLFHSSIFADTEEKKSQRNKTIEFIKGIGKKKFIDGFFPGLFHPDNVSNLKTEISEAINQGLSTDESSMIRYMEMMRDREDLSETLKNAEFPVHFISGAEDQSVPLKTSHRQMVVPQKAGGIIIDDCAHMGMFERPMEASASLLGFIQNIA